MCPRQISCRTFSRTPGVRNQPALRFLVPSSVPLRALTKLPAYPSSPTPICATGALVWTSPPASERNEAHSGSIHLLKAVTTLLGVNIYLNSLFGNKPPNAQISQSGEWHPQNHWRSLEAALKRTYAESIFLMILYNVFSCQRVSPCNVVK